jgi:hypothetical protein
VKHLERFATFSPGFSNPTHDLSPITNRKEFASQQLKNALFQAAFCLSVAREWAQETDVDDSFFIELSDAEHHAEAAQLKLID